MAITFQNSDTDFVLKQKGIIKQWLKIIVEKENRNIGDINFVFTNDQTLLSYNQQYLQHNTFTDIITFDTSTEKKINGDIIISIERVGENAKKFKTDFENELHRVVAHGVLHLLGYKDKSKKDVIEMRKQEELALKQFKRLS